MNVTAPLIALTAAALIIPLAAQTPQTRPVSLEDCLAMALQRNLDIRIARYSPLQDALTLNSAYHHYDPNFTMGASQGFRRTEGFTGIGQFNTTGNESWTERYDAGISGAIPTGLTYNISSAINRQSGLISQFDARGNLFEKDTGFIYTPAVGITLTQPLLKNLWIDQPRLTIQLERHNLRQSESDLQAQVMQSVTDVAVAYADLIALRESARVQQKALELAQQLEAQNRKGVEVGQMSPLDLEDALAQVARSRSDLLTAQQQQAVAENTLKRLVTDDFAAVADTEWVPTAKLGAIPETFSRLDSWHKGMTLRPDLLRARLDLEKQKIQLRFTRNQMFPQLDLNGSYGYGGQDTTLTPSLDDIAVQRNPGFSGGIRLTIPFSNKVARNNHQSAKLRNEQLLLRYKQLEQGAMVDIDNAISTTKTALERVQATETFRQYSDSVLLAEQKKLESGKSTSYLVLLRQRDLTMAESQAIQAKSDYNKDLARLAQAEGATFQRYQLKLELR